ncbi:MAG: hypothetical protein KGO94_06670, partial [Alphaproteobacteria bacterium]|nr:hypothetical protein [Alphaproteobacteria bacterium]
NRLFDISMPIGLNNPKYMRLREIWLELGHKLSIFEHTNAVAVLLRVLLELSVDNYGKSSNLILNDNDKLSNKIQKVSGHLNANGKIDAKYLQELTKLQRNEEIISVNTLNRYVHSSTFDASPRHLKMLWNTLSKLIIECVSV